MDPFEFLYSLEQFGIKLGLTNIRAICEHLGHPERACRTLIVAGTNGKGSVSAMLHTALGAAGYRAARYTSPHLIHLEERFVIGDAPIDRPALASALSRVRAAIEDLRATGVLATSPTFFEATTATAFEAFRAAKVEVAVLEVGLGGRFDATNIASPAAAAITSIDLDHEQHLGRTIAEIAFEKAGVIHPGMIVVVGERKPEALEVIARACDERGARLVQAAAGVDLKFDRADKADGQAGQTLVTVTTPTAHYHRIPLALAGRHQVDNAVVAIRLLEELEQAGWHLPHDAIVTGLTRVKWPGRLETIDLRDGRRVLLDAAHNPAGMAVLADHLMRTDPAGLPIVFAVMKDKDARSMLEQLAPRASVLIVTEAPTPRTAAAATVAALAREVAPHLPVEVAPDPGAALRRAWTYAPSICAAGSIFLIGWVLALLSDPPSGLERSPLRP